MARIAEPLGGRLLLVDDSLKLCRMVREYLEPFGYEVTAAHTGPDGLDQALRGNFDAVLLDVMLPEMDGFEVLRRLRLQSAVPVLMLTARGEAPSRIEGLERGADDYIAKTCPPRELLARLRAVLRRSLLNAARLRLEPQPPIVVGPLRVDEETRTATLADRVLPLTPTEFDLLVCLARDCNRVKSREELLLDVADRNFEAFDRSIDMHISSLRKKLGDDPRAARWIVTVRAAGYLLHQPAEEPPC